MLEGVGRWLAVNGEAIYGTRPWKKFGEGPTEIAEGAFQENVRKAFTEADIRYTRRGETLYATCFGWPEKGELLCPMLARWKPCSPLAVEKVDLLGGPLGLVFHQDNAGLHIILPTTPPDAETPVYSFRITMRGA